MKKSNKKTERFSPALSSVLLIVGIILLFSVLLGAMYSTGLLTPPAFLTGIFGKDNPETGNEALLKLIESIKNHETADFDYTTVNPDELTQYLIRTSIPQSYVKEYTVVYSDGDVRSSHLFRLIMDGDRFCVNKYTSDYLIETVISDGSKLVIRDAATETETVMPKTDAITPDSIMASTSVSELLSILRDYPENGTADSSIGTVKSCALSLVQNSESNLAYIVLGFSDDSQRRDEYYIDLDTAALISAECYTDNKLCYSMTMQSFSTDLSPYNLDELFGTDLTKDE